MNYSSDCDWNIILNFWTELKYVFLDETEQTTNKRPRADQTCDQEGSGQPAADEDPINEEGGDLSEDDVSDEPPDQDAELGELLRRYEPLINVGHRIHPRQAIYNFRVDDNFVFDQLVDELRNIYRQNSSAFKINLNFSFVLRNIETGELRFFYASNNTAMLDRPMLIHDNASFRDFIEVLRTLDILEWVRNHV